MMDGTSPCIVHWHAFVHFLLLQQQHQINSTRVLSRES